MSGNILHVVDVVIPGYVALTARDNSHVDMRIEMAVASAVAVALATVITLLRAYVRRLLLRQWGMDDWAAMVSYVLVLATGILIGLTTHYGVGKAPITAPPRDLNLAAALAKVSIIAYQASVTALKATFLLQYRRIFPLPSFQRLCDAVFAFNLLFGLSLMLSFAIRCSPAWAAWVAWRPPVPGGGAGGPPANCIDVVAWWYVNASVNLVTDLIILAMPMPMLRSLPLARKPKLVLFGLFGLGAFTTAINIIRITYLKRAATSPGDTYSASLSSIFAIVELCSATVCVCVPTLRPLIGSTRRQMSPLQGKKTLSIKVPAGSPFDSTASLGANSARNDKAIPMPTLQAFHPQARSMEGPQGHDKRQCACDDGGSMELGPVAALRRDLSTAWTVGTGTETDDESVGPDLRDGEPSTPLFPPPRSHASIGPGSVARGPWV